YRWRWPQAPGLRCKNPLQPWSLAVWGPAPCSPWWCFQLSTGCLSARNTHRTTYSTRSNHRYRGHKGTDVLCGAHVGNVSLTHRPSRYMLSSMAQTTPQTQTPGRPAMDYTDRAY